MSTPVMTTPTHRVRHAVTAGFPTNQLIGFLRDLQAAVDSGRPAMYREMLRENWLPEYLVEDMTLVTAGLIIWQEGQGFVVTGVGRSLIPTPDTFPTPTNTVIIYSALRSIRMFLPTAVRARIRVAGGDIVAVQDVDGTTLWEQVAGAQTPAGILRAQERFPADWALRDLPGHDWPGNHVVVRF